MQASKSGTAHDATTHFGRTGRTWVSIASQYNNGEPVRIVSEKKWFTPLPSRRIQGRKLSLQVSGWRRSVAQSPHRQRPGKKQHERQHDGIAVCSIVRVRLPKQLRRTANQGSGSYDKETAKNVKAHQPLYAEHKN